MTEEEAIKFPDRSINENGDIVDIDLWVDEFEGFFDQSIVSEIKSTIDGGLRYAPYILISCAIDFLVSYWSGSESKPNTYAGFVDTYFDNYDGDLLYEELRCKMVHNLSVGARTIICWDESDLHKETLDDTTIVLNREEFFQDFIEAKNRYFSDLRGSSALLYRQVERFNKMGVLADLDPDEVRRWVASG